LETEDKFEHLLKFLKENKNESILIFLNDKREVDNIMKILNEKNIQAYSVHGSKTQSDRNKSIRDFSLGYKKVLISTDLLSRGMDFPYVYCVINFDVPSCIENYIHRIGRTGRLGQKGLAIAYLDKINDKNKENIINLLNNFGQEVPPWTNDVEYQKRYNNEQNRENFTVKEKIQRNINNDRDNTEKQNNDNNNITNKNNNEWNNYN